MSDALLCVRGLEAGYGGSQVLFGVDLEVGYGEVVSLLGRNGMGKTTAILSIMGLLPPRAGEIRFAGRPISRGTSSTIIEALMQLWPNLRSNPLEMVTQSQLVPRLDAAKRGLPAAPPKPASPAEKPPMTQYGGLDVHTVGYVQQSQLSDPRQGQPRSRLLPGSQDKPVVPVIAVSRIGGTYFAFVAETDQKGGYVVHQKPLQIGQIVGNNYVVIEGVKLGDKVVVSGTQYLIDGIPVVPQESSS